MTDSGPNPPSSPQNEGFSYRSLLRNYISLSGLALAAVALANIVILFLIDVTSAQPSPYTGILAYMVFPGFLIAGLALAAFGVWRERHRRLQAVPGGAKLPDDRPESARTAQPACVLPELCFCVHPAQRCRQLPRV